MKAKISVLGLYQYDETMFSDMALPEGIDGEVLTWEILEECAELEVLYSDPAYMKASLYNWSLAMLPSWQKMYDALTAEYNPIWNKDGTIEETETRDLDRTDKTQTNTSSAGENIHSVAGYNSGTAQMADKDNSSGSASGSGSSSGTEDETIKRSRKEYGNIGVTTTQHMIQEERDIADFDIYNYIIRDFKYRFCILVY